ncbi:uncharacterized protein YALI1_E31555g [Yarrowia lipolytica]|uniref:Uncharacterized protein n=1 Tax=Yarrowia lipolytica TaxID=4952 RepID=A0A1D8NK34_YARLL|nr:hypothetical protein YALI1_E31555g [Yarrowia lipolytica]
MCLSSVAVWRGTFSHNDGVSTVHAWYQALVLSISVTNIHLCIVYPPLQPIIVIPPTSLLLTDSRTVCNGKCTQTVKVGCAAGKGVARDLMRCV